MKKRFIYLMKCHDFYKIGIANNVEERLAGIQTGNPYPVEVVAKFEVAQSTARRLEKLFHTILGYFRVRGEWFELTPGKIEVITNTCRVAEDIVKKQSEE